MDIMDAIHTRRSTRTFTDEPVSAETTEILLRAAMAAPSANNERPWRFVVVRDRDTLALLSKTTPYAAPIGRSPMGIVLFSDTSVRQANTDISMLDCALAGENLMLAAHAQGLGTVWLAVWPFAEFVATIRTIIGAPDHAVPVAMFAVGVPEKPAAPVDRFEPSWVHAERWGQE